jgi:hypothetical protein
MIFNSTWVNQTTKQQQHENSINNNKAQSDNNILHSYVKKEYIYILYTQKYDRGILPIWKRTAVQQAQYDSTVLKIFKIYVEKLE